MTYSFLGITMIAVASITTAGCSSAPKRVEADYGNSVNQMVQAATYNPEAAASTESIPVIGMDGKRALRSLDAMRTDTERVDDFNDVIDIELGGN
jgi:hypothetical protein